MPLGWFALSAALAGSSLDADKVCQSQEPVALSMGAYRRVPRRPGPSCPGLVPSLAVADYLKAYAVLSRELHQVEHADQLVRLVGARWLILEDGPGFAVYDGKAKAFVDSGLFLVGGGTPTTPQEPAEVAYQAAYRALRAKRHRQARATLTECLQLDPDHAGCHWEMGWVDWVAEDWAAVVTSWQQVQRIAPEYPELATWLPQAREKAGKDQEPPGSSDSGATHCAAAETVGFSCPIGDNVLSLCWAAGEARVLHYRFGAPGSVALSWPRVPGARFEDSFALSFDVLPAPPGGTVRPRLENTTLSFEVDGNQYTVFEELHDFEPHAQGVKVLVGGTKEVTLSCTATSARLLSKLEP